MEKLLNILLLEDNYNDAEIIKLQLTKNELNCQLTHIDNKYKFIKQLNTSLPDIILSDYSLVKFTGLDALEIAKQTCPHVPFIIVTGTLDEETAAITIKAGAWDYVVKERITRLIPAIKNALHLKKENEQRDAALEKLRKSEERFSLAVEGSMDGVWDWDLLTNKMFLSKRWKEILGYKEKDLPNHYDTWEQLLHPDDRDNNLSKLKKHLGKKTSHYEVEFRLKCKNGEYKWILARGKAIFDNDGKAYRMAGSFTDISERKKFELKLETLSKAIKHAPVSVVITDNNGIIEYINQKFTEITGYCFEEAIGQNMNIVNSSHYPKEFYVKLWRTIKSGKEWNGTLLNKKKNGNLFWEQSSISGIKNKDGDIEHYVGVKEDITKKFEAKDSLIKAKRKAEESDRLKSVFLANMSHEIRTPMNGILGFTELLANDSLASDKKKYYANIVKLSTERLLMLLTDIIDFSKIEARLIEIHRSEFILNNLLEELLAEFQLIIAKNDKNHIQLKLHKSTDDPKLQIVTDEVRLKQIFTNLLNNAIKFTDKGFIEFGYQQVKEDTYLFYVKDTGIGIIDENHKLIFERFRQADESIERNYEGAGLGLSISKGLVERLGGQIWLESEIGKGTTFFFTLPVQIKEPHVENRVLDNEAKTKLQKTKVLVVEDDPANILYFKEIFEDEQVNCIFSKTGRGLFDILKNNPDTAIILTDIRLPDMNGLDLAKKVKEQWKNIPIIAQTAYAMPGDKEKCIKAGCDDYIEKPINRNILIKKILNLI